LHADLTEVIQLRERLFLKDNLARLGEISAGIAHELRNGLATILGNARLLQQAVASDDEAKELVEAVVEEGNALNRVVAEFLQFARPDKLRLASVDIEALVRELVDELDGRARASGVRLILAAESSRADADEVLLKQAVQNLILNGIEAAGSVSKGEVNIRVGEFEDHVVIGVHDNGPGVPEGDRQRIFMPFFTTKSEGTGLGLSLVQKIVVAHNGEVTVDRLDDGTQFDVKIPLKLEALSSMEEWV
jgi:two-component system sensor histidine kinase HydH